MSDLYHIGTSVFNNWVIKRRIGAGSFGEVFEIEREDFGTIYTAALKVIRVPQSPDEYQDALEDGLSPEAVNRYFYSVVEDVVGEFAIMSKFKGTANVVSYEDHNVVPHPDGQGWDILIRMELLTPLKAFTLQNPFTRRDIIRLGIDMLKALELCQKYNVIHRDIKPENIFISPNGDFKLGDFGIARTIEKTTSGMSKKGTYTYMAPEVYLGKEYGFSVDTYSLGLVLYRLLNRNRAPFLPDPPEPITYAKQEDALVKRMSNRPLPKPWYAEGRLAEIVMKACAFEPKDRYSSPMEMREELEAILYTEDEAEFIYPFGDDVDLPENKYLSHTPGRGEEQTGDDTQEETQAGFGRRPVSAAAFDEAAAADTDRTQSQFDRRSDPAGQEVTDTDRTQSQFGRGYAASDHVIPGVQQAEEVKPAPSSNKLKIGIIALAAVVALGGGGAFLLYRNAQKQGEQYVQLVEEGKALCSTDPTAGKELISRALEIDSEKPEALVAYAYALYCERSFDACIAYIEDDLAMGKAYGTEVQNSLSEILGSAYFEKSDYAAAASFFRLSTAGEDVTVSAMRDYAVSLGRLGDVEAADEVLQRMFREGADSDVTDYVQAEVHYGMKEYVKAESGFRAVMDQTDDLALQKRCLRSLGEVYRDCAALARTESSPIDHPSTKAAELLSDGIVKYELRYDSTLWEMLAMAYFESYHMDANAPREYLTKAADCFARVIEMGVTRDYLYANLYSIYYEMKDYEQAEEALQAYEAMYPQDYLPHAYRGMMLITQENAKEQSARDYSAALAEYETARSMLRSGDDPTYFQQLENLVRSLKQGGWI